MHNRFARSSHHENITKMRFKMAKMRPKMTKMRLKMVKMRPKMAKTRLKMASIFHGKKSLLFGVKKFWPK